MLIIDLRDVLPRNPDKADWDTRPAEVRAIYESGGPVPVITDPVAFGSIS